jgi:iron(III) transport system substrate-binding protein
MRKFFMIFIAAMLLVPAVMAQEASPETLTVYSGRNEELIGPLLQQFTEETGIQVEVVYGDTAAIANQIIEEGQNSPADVVIAQDAGALGALAQAGLLRDLPADVLERVPAQFASPDELWVGLSGRARVLVYNPQLIEEQGLELPNSILDLTKPEYSGLVGWAPANASFQSNVTAMRVLLGEDVTAQWLADMVANGTVSYGSSNTNLNNAVANGEILMGITNHYYMHQLKRENPDLALAHHFFPEGDAGSLINVAGTGILATSDQPGLSQRLILYLLSSGAQEYFNTQTAEYPLVAGIELNENLTPLSEISAPELDLNQLSDLQTTLQVIEDSGALDQ